MELNRFYCSPIAEPVSEVVGTEAHHLANVLRLSPNDKVELIDGLGALATAIIKTVSSKKAVLQIERLQRFPQPGHSKIIIAPSIAKGDRFDWLIGKCTELGVDRICPILFERTVKQPKNPKIVERWNNIAISAAKQCRRIFLPRIDGPASLAEAIETVKKDCPQSQMVFGSISEESQPLISRQFAEADIIAFVGPEGGFTEKEQNLLIDSGAQPVRLTDTVLRIETAAVAFAAILATQRQGHKVE